jgi:hypothetical protein
VVLGVAGPNLDVDYIPRDGIALLLLEAWQKCGSRCQARMMDATLLQAQVALSYSEIRYPSLSMGAVSFVIALWGVSGFLYDHELLQATFLLFVPLLSVVPLRLWLARKLDGAEVTYETYYGLITRYRRLCLMVAAFTIFLSTFWGMIYNLAHANILT